MEYYNKWLSKKWIRWINYAMLVILALAYYFLGVYEIARAWSFLISVITGLLIGGFRFDEQVKDIRWSEWNNYERRRKFWFTHNYTIINSILCVLFAYSCNLAGLVIDNTETSWMNGRFIIEGWDGLNYSIDDGAIVNGYSVLIPPIIFFVNICYTISLFLPAFEDDLPRSISEPKPENWDERRI